MRSGPGRNVAVIFHRLGPYHFARLRAAGQMMVATAIEISAVDDIYAWDLLPGEDGFTRITLFTQMDSRTLPPGKVVGLVGSALNELRPEVVAIAGWSEKEALGALGWCLKTRTPAVVMSDSTAWDETRVPWKEWVKRRLIALCGAGFVAGSPHSDYLAGLGMDRSRIFLGYDTVDNAYFEAKAREVRDRQRQLAVPTGLPDRYFLATARFVTKKNLQRLIRGYGRYRQLVDGGHPEPHGSKHKPWDLVLMGDGPLKSELTQLINELGLGQSIVLTGFRQYQDLPSYYGLASAFILASTTDQWGLVVNEAMASGLPVLVSNRCGCAMDLVREGINGYTFDPYQEEEIAASMLRIAGNPTGEMALEKMGAASQEMIKDWGLDRFAHGLLAAVEAALKHPRPRFGLLDRMLLRGLIYK